MRVVFDWAEIISNEISYHLSNFMKTKRFFMTSYLVFSLVYCNVFEGLPPRGDIDIDNDPFSSGTLYYGDIRHHFIYVKCKMNLLGNSDIFLLERRPMRLTEVVLNFLDGKGIHVYDEESTHIRLFIFEGKPFLLPHFVCDKYFVAEVYRQYKSWSSFFNKKRNCQFISFPF
jgi:hypothetical protein